MPVWHAIEQPERVFPGKLRHTFGNAESPPAASGNHPIPIQRFHIPRVISGRQHGGGQVNGIRMRLALVDHFAVRAADHHPVCRGAGCAPPGKARRVDGHLGAVGRLHEAGALGLLTGKAAGRQRPGQGRNGQETSSGESHEYPRLREAGRDCQIAGAFRVHASSLNAASTKAAKFSPDSDHNCRWATGSAFVTSSARRTTLRRFDRAIRSARGNE